MYQHHIMVKTAEPLDSETALLWYKTAKDFAPDNVHIHIMKKTNQWLWNMV